VPRALLFALSLIAVLYVGLQVVAQGVLGAGLAAEKAPLVATAGVVFGPGGAWLLSATLVFSVIGYFSADMLCNPRCMYALAEQGQLPRSLAAIHPRFRTPAVAIIVYSALCFLMAIFGSFKYLAIVASSATLLLYGSCMLGLLRLRSRGVARAGKPFIVRGGPVVPIVVTLLIGGMLASLDWKELGAALVVIVVAATVYGVALKRSLRSGTPTR
jgi:amino acid transporter